MTLEDSPHGPEPAKEAYRDMSWEPVELCADDIVLFREALELLKASQTAAYSQWLIRARATIAKLEDRLLEE